MSPKIETLYTEDSRFRKITKDNGEILYLPGVTTILQHVKVNTTILDNWKEEQAEKLGVLGKRIQFFLDQERGTSVHRGIERWNGGADLDWKKDKFTDEEWARLHRYMQWEAIRRPEFLSSETVIYSEAHGFAGQTDGVVHLGDTGDEDCPEGNYIIDFKTGKDIYDSHLLQAAAYYTAYNEMGLEPRVDGVLILVLNARTKKGWKECYLIGDDLDHYVRGFLIHKHLFDWSRPDFKPEVECFPSKFSHGK